MQSSPELTKITSSSPDLTKFKMTRTDKESLIGIFPHLVICNACRSSPFSKLANTILKLSVHVYDKKVFHTRRESNVVELQKRQQSAVFVWDVDADGS